MSHTVLDHLEPGEDIEQADEVGEDIGIGGEARTRGKQRSANFAYAIQLSGQCF